MILRNQKSAGNNHKIKYRCFNETKIAYITIVDVGDLFQINESQFILTCKLEIGMQLWSSVYSTIHTQTPRLY